MASNNLKSIIVTGANSGIGFAVAKKLCSEGYDVLMACRNTTKAKSALDSIKYSQPSASVSTLELDLCDFSSVRSFVRDFREMEKSLYALICNAGIMMPMKGTERKTTKDGHEITMQANYLGHFLLTNLLLDDLKAGAEKFGEARIVNVSSSLQDPEKAKGSLRGKDFQLEEVTTENFDFEREGSYIGINAYMNSKSAQVMSAYVLAEKVKNDNVLVNSVCPGFIPTTELSQNHGYMAGIFMKWVLPTIFWLSGRSNAMTTIDEGCRRVFELATSSEYKDITGKFFSGGKMAESKGCTNDVELQKKMWDFSVDKVELQK